jgi:hypothetical protein
MPKYSMKKGGKEIGPASVYAEPHTMTGKKVTANKLPLQENGTQYTNTMNMSVGNVSRGKFPPVNKNGATQIRGTGAATKAKVAHGPMA